VLESAGLCYYLIPWPGPQAMFLILIREELLTIEMQSSPRCKIGTRDKISTQNTHKKCKCEASSFL